MKEFMSSQDKVSGEVINAHTEEGLAEARQGNLGEERPHDRHLEREPVPDESPSVGLEPQDTSEDRSQKNAGEQQEVGLESQGYVEQGRGHSR